MGKPEFLAALEQGIALMRQQGSPITLVHHNDADGLASAAVMQTALQRAGFSVNRIPLERVHPPIIERIHAQAPSTILYVDLGAKGAPAISAVNRGRRLTLIVDHHHPEPPTDAQVIAMSSESYGVSGDLDISAATAAYLFALLLDPQNRDLAYLGVVGAIGDSHERTGRLVGENREALQDAVEQGQVRIEETDGREQYLLTKFQSDLPLKPFAKSLTTLGAAGYYMDGPAFGMTMCLEGPSPTTDAKFEELNATRQAAYDRALQRLRQQGFRTTEHIQWFIVGDDFAPMGVKMIGEFCMEIRDEGFVDPQKYLVGFQTMAPEVPGLGTFDWSSYKVSMRVPSPLEQQIIVEKTMPGLAYLVPEAAKQVGGSIDACHDYAAATVIDIGQEEALITAMEDLITT
ncbi:hypothetical protein GF339_06870 [candidate division KSB3 bacterium]|uniref:DDH domain-containing protein n=1 Tax=candidate division KSB3 bacterium TaxID=2044937 RepID=A0A9D5JUD5_9BACT|nr:hypothetical protein [candidate division KSB3 bacterium]MBD3324289.1 hypothetical protein [candidate division KSB3 bacterium]